MMLDAPHSLTRLNAPILIDVPDNMRVVVGGCFGSRPAPLPPLGIRRRVSITIGSAVGIRVTTAT